MKNKKEVIKMEKILSIGVAAYNVQDYLEECVNSIVNTDAARKIELIIVDDGSRDNTKVISEKFCEMYPDIIRLVSKENGGWGSTLNSSIAVATGKYFKQLDADDMFITNNLMSFIDFLEQTDADIVFSKYQSFSDETGEVIAVIDPFSKGIPYKGYVKDLPWDIQVLMHTIAVKTELLTQKPINITEHCFYTDVEFVIKALNRCKTYAGIDAIIYSYRLDRVGQSVSIEGKRKHYKDHEKALRENLYFYKTELCDELKGLVSNRIKRMIDNNYEILFILEPNKEHKKMLTEFDMYIKNDFPEFYDNVGKKVKLLRISKFVLYTCIVKINTKMKSK